MVAAAAPPTRQLAAARDRISLLSRQRDALEARVSELSSRWAQGSWESSSLAVSAYLFKEQTILCNNWQAANSTSPVVICF